MKALKILAVVLGVVVLAVGGFFGWFYVAHVRAPEPQAYCDHTVSLMREELAGQQADDLAKDCLSRATREQERDAVKYAKNSKCAMGAKTFAELGACSTGAAR
jgi:hypothetical protein